MRVCGLSVVSCSLRLSFIDNLNDWREHRLEWRLRTARASRCAARVWWDVASCCAVQCKTRIEQKETEITKQMPRAGIEFLR